MLFRKWTTLLLLVTLVLCIPVFGQNQPEGRIAGVVRDASGAVIPNAVITITNQGTNAKFTVTSGEDGGFLVPTVPVGAYRVEISAKGFTTGVYTDVQVEPAKTYSLTAQLKVGGSTETVEVVAGQDFVNTTNSELSNTITANQVQNLPLLGRDIIGLASTQAGVQYNQRAATSINGQRPSWSQVTLDGISIQDLYIRTNALDYIPNRPTTDTVESFTVTTGTQGADASMGSSGVRMVTPSGTNELHGSVWDYNRNSKFSANSWFNDYRGIDKPFLNRNEYGAKLLGPIIKNKLFFNVYYIGIKERQSQTQNITIPQNDDMLQGWFRYLDASGVEQRVNVLTGEGLNTTVNGLQSLALDSHVQSTFLSKIFPASKRNNPIGAGDLNTATYSYPQRANYNRDNPGGKVDYEISSKHHLDATFSYMHEYTDRGEYSPYDQVPLVYNDSHPKLFSMGWRYTVTDHLVNTARVGFNLTDAPFDSNYHAPDGYFIGGDWYEGFPLGLTNPQPSLVPQGRQSNSYQIVDNAAWAKGKHNVTFGGSLQAYRVHSWDEYEVQPTYYTGQNGFPRSMQLLADNFPCDETGTLCGADNMNDAGTDLAAAINLRSFLGGLIQDYAQTFNATSATSGFVPGARQDRRLPLNDLSFFVQDNFRALPNLNLTLGLKWEYLSPYKESNNLALGPVYTNPKDPMGSLLTDQVGNIDILHDAWKKQLHNFGPSVGFAWDPFKNGKTSFRGGYTMTFVNDDVYRFAGNAADGNSGISTEVLNSDYLANTFSDLPNIPVPTFKMPRTYADQLAENPTNVVWALDPNAKTPMVHELYFGIQRELPSNMSMEVRYVGTFGRDLLRGMDLNQANVANNPAFMADFGRARANLFNCGNAYFVENQAESCTPGYTMQALPTFETLTYLPTFLYYNYFDTYLRQNAAAGFATFMLNYPAYFANDPEAGTTGAFSYFLPNPSIYAMDYGYNGAFSSYHGLQAELKRRFKNGLQFEANYTWSKLLSNSPADTGQTRFDPFLDNNRQFLAKARSNYDLRHQFKANFIYELPFGKGRAFGNNMNGVLDKVLGGWQASSIFVMQSGNPFSILAARSTFSRRNGTQTPMTSLTVDQIKSYMGITMCPDAGPAVCGYDSHGNVKQGVYYISPLLTDPYNSGRAVSPDTLTQTPDGNFNQLFFNPGAGQIGNLGLMAFDGPGYWNIDMGLMKQFKVTERINTQFRADFFNMPNHPQFYFGDTDINSSGTFGFGRVNYTNSAPRVIQFSLRVDF